VLNNPLSKDQKDRVQDLLGQIAAHLHNWPYAFKEGRNDIAYSIGIQGVSESDLHAAQSAFRELEGMGSKIIPELILSLNDQKPQSCPISEVEAILFNLQGQQTIIAYIVAGKLNSAALKTVENMLEYDDWRRTWFLPLFSSQAYSAREFAYTALPKKLPYCWEYWEIKNGTQPMLDLYINAARTDKEVNLRKMAIDALSKIYEVIEENEGDSGARMDFFSLIGPGAPNETIGDAGKRVSVWRAAQKPKRDAQKEQIARAFCDMLNHDADASIRQSCAHQLRRCKEAFIEPAIKQALTDADAGVRDECTLYLMKRAGESTK
jgi:hypothetical protein